MVAVDVPPEDHPFYVMIGAEGPWTPTGLAERLVMPHGTDGRAEALPQAIDDELADGDARAQA